MKTYQYTSPENTVVAVFDEDGISRMSMLASLVPDGTAILSYVAPTLTDFETDQILYRDRSAARTEILAYLYADSMSRVRTGAWTEAQMRAVMRNPSVVEMYQHINTMAYELAAEALNESNNPMLTAQIKADWTAKLTEQYSPEIARGNRSSGNPPRT